jgi:hypothetical protein
MQGRRLSVATSSFYHNVVIDTNEKAVRLTEALDASVAWGKAHPEEWLEAQVSAVITDETAVEKLAEALKA